MTTLTMLPGQELRCIHHNDNFSALPRFADNREMSHPSSPLVHSKNAEPTARSFLIWMKPFAVVLHTKPHTLRLVGQNNLNRLCVGVTDGICECLLGYPDEFVFGVLTQLSCDAGDAVAQRRATRAFMSTH